MDDQDEPSLALPYNAEFVQQSNNNQCDDLAEENELLRAKLGHLGLPTEGIPEEDHMNMLSRYNGLCTENRILKAKLNSYHNPDAMCEGRTDDWNVKYDMIVQAYKLVREAGQQQVCKNITNITITCPLLMLVIFFVKQSF